MVTGMKTRVLCASLFTASAVIAVLAHRVPAQTQGGDQFLDGIGETGLVARYVLGDNAEDSSRNQFHASLRGNSASFVEDQQFRRALLLTGDGSYIQLPGRTLEGEDTISVTGWLYLPTGASGPVFDFGQNAATRIFAAASGSGFRASVVSGGTARGETATKPLLENQWLHFAVVLDPAGSVLTTYVDGAKAGEADNVRVNAAQIVNQSSADANRLFLGRSQNDNEPTLHGRLRDVRIYRIALADKQVATIRANAISGRQSTRGRGAPPPEISTAAIPRESPLASRVSSVSDITVETVVGILPRLPHTVPALYQNNSRGPEVRVIWPAAVDTKQVSEPGSYTVTGKVPLTTLEPKATVIVKAPVGTTTPPGRLAESFPLSQVVLDRDASGRETSFIPIATNSSAAWRPAIRTCSSTTSGTRSASRSLWAHSNSRDGTTRPRGCAAMRAVTT